MISDLDAASNSSLIVVSAAIGSFVALPLAPRLALVFARGLSSGVTVTRPSTSRTFVTSSTCPPSRRRLLGEWPSTSPRSASRSCAPKDTGTLEYDLFLNPHGTECFVHGRYRNSAKGLDHMANIGRMMKPLSEVCTITGEVCGTPSPELRTALEGAKVTIYAPFQTLSPERRGVEAPASVGPPSHVRDSPSDRLSSERRRRCWRDDFLTHDQRGVSHDLNGFRRSPRNCRRRSRRTTSTRAPGRDGRRLLAGLLTTRWCDHISSRASRSSASIAAASRP